MTYARPLIAFTLAILAACGEDTQPPQHAPPAAAPRAPEHYYSLKDGQLYGYEPVQRAGDTPSPLVMFRYLGERGGQHQLLQTLPDVEVVIQCGIPCEFYRAMAFSDGRHLKTERVRLTQGSIAWMAIEDARSGQLERAVARRDGRPHTAWYDVESGLVLSPVKSSASGAKAPAQTAR